jgi:hypothetical protein
VQQHRQRQPIIYTNQTGAHQNDNCLAQPVGGAGIMRRNAIQPPIEASTIEMFPNETEYRQQQQQQHLIDPPATSIPTSVARETLSNGNYNQNGCSSSNPISLVTPTVCAGPLSNRVTLSVHTTYEQQPFGCNTNHQQRQQRQQLFVRNKLRMVQQ